MSHVGLTVALFPFLHAGRSGHSIAQAVSLTNCFTLLVSGSRSGLIWLQGMGCVRVAISETFSLLGNSFVPHVLSCFPTLSLSISHSPFHDRPAFVPLFHIPTTNIFFLRPTLSLAAVDRTNRVCAALNCLPCHHWRSVDEIRVMLHCRLQPGLPASCKKGSVQASAPMPSHPREILMQGVCWGLKGK